MTGKSLAVMSLALSSSFTGPSALATPATPDIDLKIQVSVPTRPVASGSEGEAIVTLTPPAGIRLNQYPPIRLTLEASPPLVFPQQEIKLGLDKMPDDLESNPFERVDPIHVKFQVGKHDGDGQIPVKGKLRFFYCVAKSGYCAPGVKTVSFSVPITSTPR